MPELPEVETIARELRPLVLGSTIESFWTDWPKAIKHPDPDAFAAGVAGRTITEVSRRAKWLVLELSGGWVIALQVKMTGQVFVLPVGTPRDRHVHLVFGLDGARELLIRDVRKFARIALYPRDEAGKALGADETDPFDALGPEPLDPTFTLARFRQLIRGRRGRLKPLLVDQAFLAGVGNIYADESLWRSKLHPLRSAASLKPADERALYTHIRAVLTEGIERRGSSVDDYTAPGGDGEMQHHLDVYQRTGQPCHRCGRPIKRFVLGIRATHFCSWCQRLPTDERTAGNLALLRSARSTTGRRGQRWSELPTGEGAVGARR
ncbi:MAG: bifunctional DNA-formamidopyrimidine glycosylase/DNA-(apurinic or apyrimidinic site) lyase [Chloroflexi bacterium]|nr:bifunctional DNA-formamidopyrimidine glycosylase/DNA-(apurinic or apyrimidinic site) lyase [Chloroflexota bacterium]